MFFSVITVLLCCTWCEIKYISTIVIKYHVTTMLSIPTRWRRNAMSTWHRPHSCSAGGAMWSYDSVIKTIGTEIRALYCCVFQIGIFWITGTIFVWCPLRLTTFDWSICGLQHYVDLTWWDLIAFFSGLGRSLKLSSVDEVFIQYRPTRL